jgi:hypothetical protein
MLLMWKAETIDKNSQLRKIKNNNNSNQTQKIARKEL